MTEFLKRYQANLTTLLLNLLNFHWNVNGALFLPLHRLYQEQYEFIFESIDEVAEIIKSKGEYPLTTYKSLIDAKDITAYPSKDYNGSTTLNELNTLFETMNSLAIEGGQMATKTDDLAVIDFFTKQNAFFNQQLYFINQFLK